jgi:iron complex transport system ATP-binding protein
MSPVGSVEGNGISVSGLSVCFGGSQVLDGISFDVAPGSLVFVIGKNGAGKSTLFKCIVGIIRHYKGEISIGGVSSASMSATARARLVAYVPQSFSGHVPYTVAEFLEMSRYPWRNAPPHAEDERAVSEAMRLTGVLSLADRGLWSLSGGETQKVMIAAAIAQETGVILMDEPTAYLDYARQVEIMEVMARINRERGVTLMAVTHDVNLAMGLAGEVLAMTNGKIHWTGPCAGLLNPELLAEIYGVPFGKYSSGLPGEHPVLMPKKPDLKPEPQP